MQWVAPAQNGATSAATACERTGVRACTCGVNDSQCSSAPMRCRFEVPRRARNVAEASGGLSPKCRRDTKNIYFVFELSSAT